jgi:molybdate transport system ATP-binding protein
MIRVDVALKLGAFDLEVSFENELGITALFGRSGSGKSLTINLIAGLARPDRGRVVLEGRTLVDTQTGVFVPKHRRRVGLVFQDAQLFPHLSVKQNLLFGRWFAPQEDPIIAFDSVIDALGIGRLLDRRPARLSGGEKQRVAIGRALLSSPKILLMDEPLVSLDDERKLEILLLVETLRDEFHVPIVYVSHSVEEVARLAARVVVLDNGHVAAIGSPEEVLGTTPNYPGESRFERSSVIAGRLSHVDEAYGLTEISHPAGAIWLAGRAGPIGRDVRVVIRATDVTLATARPHDLSVRTVLGGAVASIETADGPLAAVVIRLNGDGQLVALATRKAVDELGLRLGDQVFALVKTVALDERTMAAINPSP